jgi:predicted helicase
MTLDQYIDSINRRYKQGNATEHTFRGDLQQLIESMVPEVRATNEPKRQLCGAPDYILTKRDIPVGFIEAKDIGDKDLDGTKKTGNKEQFDRYKASLNNLMFTDYLHFHLYRDGLPVTNISIGELQNGSIVPLPNNFSSFTNLVKDFSTHIGQTIKSAKKLAEMMAGKARLLSEVIEKALNSDDINNENSTLKDQMNAFKQILIHDITAKGFADVYAQTIAYGMFAARLHDPTLPTFSRQEAAELIPRSNPFLRKLFGYIAGPDIDDRIKWIVDSLVDIFLACNVEEILKNYGKATRMEDPIIHFYETFLSEYDPKLRKARGVWYTPQPVVNFIVRAVDDILKTEFNLPNGLADNSKTKIKVNVQQGTDKRYKDNVKTIEEEVHRVQILDPATGTGTFLAEVIKHIHKKFAGQQGIWSNYVETHLLPRLNGFELLMASYAMAHLKLDLLLTETGYKPTDSSLRGTKQSPERLKVFLTNSLEEHHPDYGTLFANWLSTEANEANRIKRDTPVMCIIGNPPYSGESANKGEWIMKLMEDYKKEPGGKERLQERNPKWINDDYVKFLRYGQHFIEKNGSGVLAFINPHGYLDNPTFRGMRWNLLKTYDKIYTIDLHGNSKKKEVALDGSSDENVFDIQQGVSINIFVKTGNKKANDLGEVLHFDLYGKREIKYDFLMRSNIKDVLFKKLENISPNYYFVQKNFSEQKVFNEGFLVNDVFPVNNVGIVSANDPILIDNKGSELLKKVEHYYQIEVQNILVKKILYRPFDQKYVYYDLKLLGRAREKVMKHFLTGKNVGLNWIRPMSSKYEFSIFISQFITDQCSAGNKSAGAGISYIAPLYLYSDNSFLSTEETNGRTPNLNMSIVDQIAKKINYCFLEDHEGECYPPDEKYSGTLTPLDILDYIYAVLHSPTYREKYKEFLKIDFPRVPYPTDAGTFDKLVELGSELRQIHLLESPVVENYITQYPVDGNNVVDKIRFEPAVIARHEAIPGNDETDSSLADTGLGKVYINETQHFANVPEVAWNFYIGGYQPAQKWLKDRKGRKLEFDDILHYQKIIVALKETDRLMKKVDKVGVEW